MLHSFPDDDWFVLGHKVTVELESAGGTGIHYRDILAHMEVYKKSLCIVNVSVVKTCLIYLLLPLIRLSDI